MSRRTILFIDDDAQILKMMTLLFQRLDVEILDALDASRAMEIFEEHHREIDLTILDMTLYQGESLFQTFRELQPDARILITSGFFGDEADERFNGHSGFLKKPFSISEIRKLLKRFF